MRSLPLIRRLGGVLLLLVWAQVATANALPCGIDCLLTRDLAHHVHDGLSESHAIGHHATGAKVSAPEFCGSPQLMLVAAVWPDFPALASVEVAVRQTALMAPLPVFSSTPDFGTPPPRA